MTHEFQDENTNSDSNGSTSKNNFPTLYYVNFIKTKEQELIRDLRKEIQKLRHENSAVELESNITLCSSCSGTLDTRRYPSAEIREPPSSGCGKKGDYKVVMKVSKKEDASELKSKEEISRLESELESARKLIDDLKWVQIHCDSKMHVQELKLEELQKEMMELKSNELEIFTVQIPPIACLPSRSTVVTPTEPSSAISSHRRRRSSSASRSFVPERRSSLQSILPENYKDSVATLPPISFPLSTFEPMTPTSTPTSSASSIAYKKALLIKQQHQHHHHQPMTTTKLKFIPPQRHHALSATSPPHHTIPLKAPALVQTSSPSK